MALRAVSDSSPLSLPGRGAFQHTVTLPPQVQRSVSCPGTHTERHGEYWYVRNWGLPAWGPESGRGKAQHRGCIPLAKATQDTAMHPGTSTGEELRVLTPGRGKQGGQ